MGQPQARVTDMHVCPMVTPGVPPIPHVGGPILPPCAVTVLVGALPAARVTDMCLCVGPPDVIALGSFTVLIMNLPAARIGDMTAHGGSIVMGMPTVLTGCSLFGFFCFSAFLVFLFFSVPRYFRRRPALAAESLAEEVRDSGSPESDSGL